MLSVIALELRLFKLGVFLVLCNLKVLISHLIPLPVTELLEDLLLDLLGEFVVLLSLLLRNRLFKLFNQASLLGSLGRI